MMMGGGGKAPTRLVDGAAADAGTWEAWAFDMLRGAEPYRAPAGRKQRVQLRLGRVGKRPRLLFMRTVLVGVVMFGCGAIASSAFGHWPAWVVDAYQRVVGNALSAPVPASDTRVRRAESPAVPTARTAVASEPVTIAPPLAPRRVSPKPVRAWRASPAAAPEDAATIMEAMRTLALSLEAAVARGDGDAGALAARYLKLYPSGPFQALARQTTAGRCHPVCEPRAPIRDGFATIAPMCRHGGSTDPICPGYAGLPGSLGRGSHCWVWFLDQRTDRCWRIHWNRSGGRHRHP